MINKKNNSEVAKQSKLFLLELYPEWTDFNLLIQKIKEYTSYYAYIEHDCDINNETGEVKKSHYHCIIEFSSKRTIKGVYNLFNYLPLETRFIQICLNERGATRYLLHLDNPEKYQYSSDLIKTSDNARLSRYLTKDIDLDTQLNCLCEYVAASDKYVSTIELRFYAFKNGFIDAFNKFFYQISTILKEHNHQIEYISVPLQEALDKAKKYKENNSKTLIDLADLFGTATYTIDNDVYQIAKFPDAFKKKQQKY